MRSPTSPEHGLPENATIAGFTPAFLLQLQLAAPELGPVPAAAAGAATALTSGDEWLARQFEARLDGALGKPALVHFQHKSHRFGGAM